MFIKKAKRDCNGKVALLLLLLLLFFVLLSQLAPVALCSRHVCCLETYVIPLPLYNDIKNFENLVLSLQ